ncbi:MAG: pyruvate carboxylase [Vicinamibacterales bacterium]
MKKLLVANRSEIAIRCFRAAAELGLRTVAVYSHEDRFSLHRFKADEAFLIGPDGVGEPVRSYLDIDAILGVAHAVGADAVHPGYGFLSENAEFARRADAAGVRFVGPTPDQLDAFGDKTAARRLAAAAGVPTVPGTEGAVTDDEEALAAARAIGYPVIVKASFGGGGRGMRVVRDESELVARLNEARREAGAAFGRADVFLERYIPRVKHIEVQVLGDAHGNLVHLWERDCSVQRRHQKLIEVAPSVGVPQALREAICDAAVRLCRQVQYRAAGTVEFLLDADRGDFYFIEVNPRIQVEHTVTEMVTGIDLVQAQILVSQGHQLHDAPLSIPRQADIQTRGVAIQCRITTEDPQNQFVPDYGRITTYRSPGGFSLRLDGGNGFGGAVITPYFDSLLVKLTTWGTTLGQAVVRADRALQEFRIRGVKTNIAFLRNVILHPTFGGGEATTDFVDRASELYEFPEVRDRATKLLTYLADVIVNGRDDVRKSVRPDVVLSTPVPPPADRQVDPPAGTRQLLQSLGPEKFAAWVRDQDRLLITDTTFRDAHQSLLATRVRTYDLLAVSDAVARELPGLFSLEMWGGATFDTSMRFLQEDPWARLADLRARIPNVLFQMLLRASNAVGYTSYPDNVVREFIRLSAAGGIDVFRIFDSLNATGNMRVAMEGVREDTDAICEAAICYTGDILDPARTKYSLDYYVRMAKELVAMGTHILAIKDMAGLCKPFAARALVKALRDEVGVPIHFHTHDTSGINAASVLYAAEAGVDIADTALASMSGMTSQPCLNAVAAALRHGPRDTGLDAAALDRLSDYWAAVRSLYYPFDEGLNAPAPDVYQHEMPGGQYTNLRQQAKSLGLAPRWREVCAAYAAANQLLGDIVKVTPSSKVVGDLALYMVTNDLSAEDVARGRGSANFPKSVVEMMQGLLGTPEGGWPAEFQSRVLSAARVDAVTERPGAMLPPADFDAEATALEEKSGRAPSRQDVMSSVLYPKVYETFDAHRTAYYDTSVIPTPNFFYGLKPGEETAVEIEKGKTLIIRYLTTGELHEDGKRTVFFELNGQPREVSVPDRTADVAVKRHVKADPSDPGQVAAPMPGKVSVVSARAGDSVKAGDRLLSIEAMKMETPVYAAFDGTVEKVEVAAGAVVEAGELSCGSCAVRRRRRPGRARPLLDELHERRQRAQPLEHRVRGGPCLPDVRLAPDGIAERAKGLAQPARLRVALRQGVHHRLGTRVDGQGLFGGRNRLGVSARRGQLLAARGQPGRLPGRHPQQPPQLHERVLRIVHADVHDALDGGCRVWLERPDHEDARRLHAAGVAALRLARVERVHQPLGHRAGARPMRSRHRREHGLARERVALDGEVVSGDMAGVIAQVHRVVGILVAVDDPTAGTRPTGPWRR